MNCIILLLLLCCCGGNGVAGNNNGNCGCEHDHHHHHNNCNRERRESVREALAREDGCDCGEREVCEAATMTPPSWQDFRGISRDCDCND